MRLKSELYKKEQEKIVDKIITILDLENPKFIPFYENKLGYIKVTYS
jgi:hypothetical protein